MRTILIGDIHGCNTALCSLLERVQPGAEDTLVLLGDLFDRGPDSWEVFQTVRTLADSFGRRFVLLLGNHEDYLLQSKLSLLQRLVWERVGRGATIQSFKAHGQRMEDAIPWLKVHGQLFYREEHLQCVHAGLMLEPIEVNDRETMLHDHDIVLQNRYCGPLTVTGHIALDSPMYFRGDGKNREKLPYSVWQELPEHGIICIDTGCGKGGKLTAMVVESQRFLLDCVEER